MIPRENLSAPDTPASPPAMRPVLVIQGPTAAGKTLLAHQLAEQFPLEIISADSRQIYRGLDIGTAKPTPAEQAHYRYHGIDICQPDETMSAAEFAQRAWQWIDAIIKRGNFPLIIGGSGLYVRTILEGFVAEPKDTRATEVRTELQKRLLAEGREALFAELVRLDPDAARRYPDRNPRRILRALEFYYVTGMPISQAQRLLHVEPPPMHVLNLILLPDRSRLYHRINQRSVQMWNHGLLHETHNLLHAGYAPSLPIFQTIGYAESVAVLQGLLSPEQAVDRTAQRTRNYAKRQYTWLRNSAAFDQANVSTVVIHAFGEEASQVSSLITHHIQQYQ